MPDNGILDTELFRLLRNENKERDISTIRLVTDQLGLEKEKAIKELSDLRYEICVSQKRLEGLNKEITSLKLLQRLNCEYQPGNKSKYEQIKNT